MGNPKILFYLGCKTTLRFEPVSFKCTSRNSSVLLVSGLKSIPRYWINGSDRLLFLLRGSSLHPPLFSSSAARKVHFGQSYGDAACPSSFHRRRPTSLRRHSPNEIRPESSRRHWASHVFRYDLSKQNAHRGRCCGLLKTGETWEWARRPAPTSFWLATTLTPFTTSWLYLYS